MKFAKTKIGDLVRVRLSSGRNNGFVHVTIGIVLGPITYFNEHGSATVRVQLASGEVVEPHNSRLEIIHEAR